MYQNFSTFRCKFHSPFRPWLNISCFFIGKDSPFFGARLVSVTFCVKFIPGIPEWSHSGVTAQTDALISHNLMTFSLNGLWLTIQIPISTNYVQHIPYLLHVYRCVCKYLITLTILLIFVYVFYSLVLFISMLLFL